MKLEQEHLTGAQSPERGFGRWTPEIHFSNVGLRRVQLEPIVIGDGHEEIHRAAFKSTEARWKFRKSRCPSVNGPTLIARSVSTPILCKEGRCATGEMMRFPESSKPMNPLSNR